MPNFEIRCTHCNSTVEHVCKTNLKQAIYALYSWAPEYFGDDEFREAYVAHGRRQGWLDENEDPTKDPVPHPFFGSQAWSYALFGYKGEARSFHALIDNVVRQAGFDPDDIGKQVYAEHEKKVEKRRWSTMNAECMRNMHTLDIDTIRGIHSGEIAPETLWPNLTEEQIRNYRRLAKIEVKYEDDPETSR